MVGRDGRLVGQTEQQDVLLLDGGQEVRSQVGRAQAGQQLGLITRRDDALDAIVRDEHQAVALEREELAQLGDGRLDDLFEIEAGGRPLGDLVEQLGLAVRDPLAGEQPCVLDGDGGDVADGRRRLELLVAHESLGVMVEQVDGADDLLAGDQGQGGPGGLVVIRGKLALARGQPRIVAAHDHRFVVLEQLAEAE